jgi:hypothetical protein
LRCQFKEEFRIQKPELKGGREDYLLSIAFQRAARMTDKGIEAGPKGQVSSAAFPQDLDASRNDIDEHE